MIELMFLVLLFFLGRIWAHTKATRKVLERAFPERPKANTASK